MVDTEGMETTHPTPADEAAWADYVAYEETLETCPVCDGSGHGGGGCPLEDTGETLAYGEDF